MLTVRLSVSMSGTLSMNLFKENQYWQTWKSGNGMDGYGQLGRNAVRVQTLGNTEVTHRGFATQKRV